MFKVYLAVITLIMTFGVSMNAHSEDQRQKSVYKKVIESGVIRCGYFSWPPYIVKDPNSGKLSGINYDYMEEIGNILDLKIEWAEEVSAGTAIEGLNTNRYDVMCATLWPDAARLKNSLMSDPEFYSSVYVVVRADDNRFDSLSKEINDPTVTIAGIEGDVTYSVPSQKFPKAKLLALPQFSDSGVLIQSLISRKADAILIDLGTVNDFNKANGGLLKLAVNRPPVEFFSESLAVKSGEQELILLLNQALRIMVEKGVSKDLANKYRNYKYFVPEKRFVGEW